MKNIFHHFYRTFIEGNKNKKFRLTWRESPSSCRACKTLKVIFAVTKLECSIERGSELLNYIIELPKMMSPFELTRKCLQEILLSNLTWKIKIEK